MSRSSTLFESACQVIPGGVNSPVRAFSGVGGCPIYFKRSEGPYLYDEDGKEYIDYVNSWGPLILGNQDKDVIAAIHQAVDQSITFGAPTEIETALAQKVCELVPSVEMCRMVNSGTEATMTAIRLARGYTNRNFIVKFEGNYHGHSDGLLVKAGSGNLTLGRPSSAGVPADITKYTLTVPYNDFQAIDEVFAKYGDDIAGIIVEPVSGNMNCVPPKAGFLQKCRETCDRFGSVLIIDEVMTGFRLQIDGAQGYYGITPDLTTFGKIIGGGMPVGALAGKKEVMSHLAPLGPVYQAGTLSGNPIAMAAGLTTLNKISQPGFYQGIKEMTEKLALGFTEVAKSHGVPLLVQHVPGMFGLFFTDATVIENLEDVQRCDIEAFKRFYHYMLEEGVYFGPSAFEAAFVSCALNEDTLSKTLNAADKAFQKLK